LQTIDSSFKASAIMKTVLLIVGIAAVLIGLLWIGQGTGLINWPASSFMIDQRPWVTRGAILTVVGVILIAVSRTGARRRP
jgi:hypothetical protein